MIVAACTSSQSAYEDSKVGHGLFTDALLRGLKGGAASNGEVTSNSLFDFIDREVGNIRQRPMQYGHTTGRIVLMHYKDRAIGKTMTVKRPQGKVAKPKAKSSGTKGTWIMLGPHFFLAKFVRRAKDGTIVVEVISGGGEDEANLAGLRTPRYGGGSTVPFACNNDAYNVRVKDIETEIIGNRHIWTMSLNPEDGGFDDNWSEMSINTGEKTFSADDIAKLRAGRILLNDSPPKSNSGQSDVLDSRIDGYILGVGNRCPVPESPIRSTYIAYGRNPNWKHFARLQVVYALKASGTMDHILELSFGSIRSGRLPVRFRGRRQRHPSSAPVTIELAGVCALG